MNVKEVFKNNEAWIKRKLAKDPNYFKNLCKGQTPDSLFIGCSDSRNSVVNLLSSEVGDIFVHRNIGNIAPNNDFNFISVLNYAVKHLKVSNVIVCGHYFCGAIEAALDATDLGFLNPWIRNIRDIYRIHRDELDAIEDPQLRANRLVEINVVEQCINIAKTVDFQRAYKEREIILHAWVFDIESGKLINLNIDTDKTMRDVEKIYKLV